MESYWKWQRSLCTWIKICTRLSWRNIRWKFSWMFWKSCWPGKWRFVHRDLMVKVTYNCIKIVKSGICWGQELENTTYQGRHCRTSTKKRIKSSISYTDRAWRLSWTSLSHLYSSITTACVFLLCINRKEPILGSTQMIRLDTNAWALT